MSRFEGYGNPFIKHGDVEWVTYTVDSSSSITMVPSTSVQDSINSIQREPTINLYRAMEENRRLKQELADALAENKYLKEIIEEGDVNVKA